MLTYVQYHIGQKIKINGVTHIIKGIDVYIGISKKPEYIRVITDKSNGYITLKRKRDNNK